VRELTYTFSRHFAGARRLKATSFFQLTTSIRRHIALLRIIRTQVSKQNVVVSFLFVENLSDLPAVGVVQFLEQRIR